MAASTLLFVGLVGTAASVLLILLQCIRGKKAVEPLILFGLSVAAILVTGFLPSESRANPVITQMPSTSASQAQEPAVPRSSYPSARQQGGVEPEDNADSPQQEYLPAVDDSSEVIEELDMQAEIAPASATISSVQPKSSAEKSLGSNNAKDDPPVYDAMPRSAVEAASNAAAGPAPAGNGNSASDNGPTLADDPSISPMSNPTLTGDPEPAYVSGPTLPGDAGTSGGGWSSSGEYIHDFSGGRVLITSQSDNSGDPVYHTGNCRAAKTIPYESESWFDSEEDARSSGRRLCGFCESSG